MKSITIILVFLLCFGIIKAQSVGIGTITPAPSAKLELASNSQGFLPPRMTLSQRNAILSPALGLVIYCYDCDELQVYSEGGTWKNMVRGTACTYNVPNIPICNQIWMAKNLDVDHYKNGDVIPQVTDPTAWSNLTTGAWCYYNNDPALGTIYGKLYNWYAVNDSRGLAPQGWHIPSYAAWDSLVNCLGGAVAGGKMKETGTTHWLWPNAGADNSSGFTGLPSGVRNSNGSFSGLRESGEFWSSTEASTTNAWYRFLYYNESYLYNISYYKSAGFSVRCLRD